MDKAVVVRFDIEAYKEYKNLQKAVKKGKKSKKKPTYEQLLNSIDNAIINMQTDYKYGVLIPKKYISKDTVKRYGTDKILRVELIGYWRLLYTIIGSEDEIIVIVLEYTDHDKYSKIFGYRKK
ncbi:MAG: hypothetical protein ISS25_03530 [Nanoarchaeota archaeon]|nr:hypothetical protein [DPANN group archaeon]MBL7116873.1 hypothetical protein [Nanoarchaeota archaeon]